MKLFSREPDRSSLAPLILSLWILFPATIICGKAIAASLHRPPEKTQLLKEERQLAAFIARGFIRLYQVVFSDRQGEVCNFTPSCSNYAYQAIKKKGLLGVVMAFDRLERCNYAAWQYEDKYYSVKWVPERGYKLYDPVSTREKH